MRSVETTRAIAHPLLSFTNAEQTSFVDMSRAPITTHLPSRSRMEGPKRRRSSLADDDEDELEMEGTEDGGSDQDLEKALSPS